jgi:hypothetical protein
VGITVGLGEEMGSGGAAIKRRPDVKLQKTHIKKKKLTDDNRGILTMIVDELEKCPLSRAVFKVNTHKSDPDDT